MYVHVDYFIINIKLKYRARATPTFEKNAFFNNTRFEPWKKER